MPEHISFFWATALPGKRQAIIDHMERWGREQRPKAKGWKTTILAVGNANPDEIVGAVTWDNTENYFANAARPEQDAWYQEFRSLFATEPQWFDATIDREWRA